MKIHIVHEYDAPVEVIERLSEEPEFKKRQQTLPGVAKMEVLSEEDDGARYKKTRMKCSASGALMKQLQKFISEPLYWIDETVLDRQQHQWTYEWDVPSFKEVKVKGVRKLTAKGPKGTRREIDGEIHVGLPLIGGIIERVLSKQMSQTFDAVSKLMNQYIAEKRKAGELKD